MKKKIAIVYILLLIVVLLCAIAVLFGCNYEEEYEYVIRYTYEYHQNGDYNGDGELDTESYNGWLRTNEEYGNELYFYEGRPVVPPKGYKFVGFGLSDGVTKIFDENGMQLPGVTIKYFDRVFAMYEPLEYTVLFVEKEIDGRLYVNEEKTLTLKQEDRFEENFYVPTPYEPNTEFLGWLGQNDYILTSELGGIVAWAWELNVQNTHVSVTSYVDHNGVTHEGNFVIIKALFDYIKHDVTLIYGKNVKSDMIEAINDEEMPDLTNKLGYLGNERVYAFSTSQVEYIPFEGKVTEPVTLYAMWEKFKTVKLHFNLFSGENDIREWDIYEISKNHFPKPQHTKDHHEFVGWYDNASFNGHEVVNPSYHDGVNDYYAKWRGVAYPVKFDSNGGEVLEDSTYIYGENSKLPIPVKEYSKFLGWCIDEELTTEPFFEMPTTAAGEYTLYAKWEDSVAISTKQDLLNIALYPDKGYYLTCDISLNGDEWIPIDTFSGNLDGQGYKIYDFSLKFTINGTSPYINDSYAFIKQNNGTIRNLTIDYFDISYSGRLYYAGALVAKNYGLIENCQVGSKGVDTSSWSSAYSHYNNNSTLRMGLVSAANFEGGKIIDCKAYTSLNVKFNATHEWNYGTHHNAMSLFIAQICGQNSSVVEGCVSSGNISVTGHAHNKNTDYNVIDSNVTGSYFFGVGGIVGKNENGATVENCGASVSLSNAMTYSGNNYGKLQSNFGGVVGCNAGIIARCYSQDTQIGGDFVHQDVSIVGVGGVVGVNQSTASVSNSYSKGFSTNARNIVTGGFVGNNFGTVQKCYAIGATFNVEVVASGWHIGGFAGYNQTSGAIRYCIAGSTIALPNGGSNVLAHQFVGDIATGAALRSCYYLDNSAVLQGDVEMEERVDNNAQELSASGAFDKQFLTSILWEEEFWDMDGVNPPTLK